MSDQDKLRERIAKVLWEAHSEDGLRAIIRLDNEAMAQAVIDELGLEVKEAGWDEFYTPRKHVIGPWEES